MTTSKTVWVYGQQCAAAGLVCHDAEMIERESADLVSLTEDVAREWAALPAAAANAYKRRAGRAALGELGAVTECAYCGAETLQTEPPKDEEDWKLVAAEHADGCEWVTTRAHSRDAV